MLFQWTRMVEFFRAGRDSLLDGMELNDILNPASSEKDQFQSCFITPP